MTTVDACDISRHGFIGAATLQLIECAFALLAFLAFIGIRGLHVVLFVFMELFPLEDVFPLQWESLVCW